MLISYVSLCYCHIHSNTIGWLTLNISMKHHKNNVQTSLKASNVPSNN